MGTPHGLFFCNWLILNIQALSREVTLARKTNYSYEKRQKELAKKKKKEEKRQRKLEKKKNPPGEVDNRLPEEGDRL